jgi:ATP:ADP antiporter, AAA family
VDISHISEPAGSSAIGRLLKVFAPVKRGEALTVVLLSLNCFILLTCYYMLKVVREPLILLGGGAELKAYASAGMTLLLLGVVPAFSWLSSRVSRIRLMTTMQLIFIGSLVVFYVLAQAKAPIGLAFFLWLGIFNVLVVSNFWSFANDLYTEEEGKRLFAIIGVGASIGAIVGAFAPHMLHKLLGIHGLMMTAIVGLGVSIVLYRIIDRHERDRKREVAAEKAVEAPPKMSKKGGFTLVLRDRYLFILAIMLLVATIINTTGEYVIGKMATNHAAGLADKDAYISNFYSSYYTWVNVVSAVLQAFVVTRVLVKFGVRRALFIMPLIVLGGWFALILFMNVTLVRVEKTAENSLDYSLHNTLRQALFLPTTTEAKYKAKAAIDTFFFRMGDVISGLVIVFLFVEVFHLGMQAFAILNACLAVCWLLLARRAGRLHDELAAKQSQADSSKAVG